MKGFDMLNRFTGLALSMTMAAICAAAPVSALTAKQSVLKEVTTTDDDGQIVTTRVAADEVLPGQTVVYILAYTNDKAASADGIVLTMPVPGELDYVEGSAELPETELTFSADGGTTFAPRDAVLTRDAEGKFVTAKAEDITHVRWKVLTSVAPGTSGELAYKAVLK